MSTPRSVVIHQPEDSLMVWCVGALSRVLAEGSQTNGTYGIVEDFVPAGSGPPMHRHSTDDEAFYVLDGEITYFIEGHDPITAGTGWFIHVPGGVIHGFRVDSKTARYLIITTPHHVEFYLEMSDPAQTPTLPPAEEPDYARIGAACEKFGVEFIGEWPN